MYRQQRSVKPRRRRSRPWRFRRGEKPLELDERFRAEIGFGPYRGQLLCRAPNDFLAWLANADTVDAKLRRVASALLADRCASDQRVGGDAQDHEDREKAPGVDFKPPTHTLPDPRANHGASVAVRGNAGFAGQITAMRKAPWTA